MVKVNFSLESAGYCESEEAFVLRGNPFKTIKFYATFAHIEHPLHGHILFDTGYTRRFYDLTKKLPFKIYAKITKVFITEEQEAKAVLARKGISPSEISYIIISHFHADHIGGLRDFDNAKFICSEVAFNDVKDKKGFFALKKGFIPPLMPEDFEERVMFIPFDSTQKSIDGLGKVVDFFNDGSILFCQLDGHAKGQIGAIVNADKKIFLISDAAWVEENYSKLHFPSPLVRLFFDSWSDFKDSLYRVRDYYVSNPDVEIIPSHCEKTYRKIRNR